MIVCPEPHHLRCVTQPDHARLAASVMEAWETDGFPERETRAVTLLAVACHDDGWEDEDASPGLDPATGRLFDYRSLPAARRERVWKLGVWRAAARSTYAAALVAQHGATLARTYARDPSWTALAGHLEAERDRWYTTGPVDPDDAPLDDRLFFLRDYAMLAMGDLVSLMACDDRLPPASRDGYALRAEGEGVVALSPDPFGGRVLRLSVPVRRVPVEACASAEMLAAAWRSAPVLQRPVTILGRGLPELP